MKFVTILLTAFFATSAFAFTGHVFWQKTYDHYEAARNAEEFRALQQKYPEQFGRIDPATVESASIQIMKFALAGDHTCAANDPRAHFEGISVGICTRMNDNGPGLCSAQSIPMPPMNERDPCAGK